MILAKDVSSRLCASALGEHRGGLSSVEIYPRAYNEECSAALFVLSHLILQ